MRGDRMKEFDGASPHVVVCGAAPEDEAHG